MVNTWKGILAIVVIYGAGVITGGLVVNHSERVKERHGRKSPGSSLPAWHPQRNDFLEPAPRGVQPILDGRRMAFVLRVHEELKVTPEQLGRIEKIVREGQERTKAQWEKVTPGLRKEMQDVKDKIRAELTPEQWTQFEELLKQRSGHRPDESAKPERRSREHDKRKSVPAPTPPPAAPAPNP
jgi:hypothetical protein